MEFHAVNEVHTWRTTPRRDVARLVAAGDALFVLVAAALITLLIPPGGERNNMGRYTTKWACSLNVLARSPSGERCSVYRTCCIRRVSIVHRIVLSQMSSELV